MVLLRISSNAGIIRVEIDQDTATLADLHRIIGDRLHLNTDTLNITLAKDESSCIPNVDTIMCSFRSFNDGDMLYVQNVDAVVLSDKSAIGGSTVTAMNIVDIEQDEAKNFLTFENYLYSIKYDLGKLSLTHEHKPSPIVPGKQTKIPLPVTLIRQPYRYVDHIELMNTDTVNKFTQRWADGISEGCVAAFLIGYYVPDKNFGTSDTPGVRAVVENMFQPKQTFNPSTGQIDIDDDQLPILYEVLRKIDLEVVGVFIAHMDMEKPIPNNMFINLAKLQLAHARENYHYTKYPVSTFVTLTLTYDPITSNPTYDAFQFSDLALSLVRDNLIEFDGNEIVPVKGNDMLLMPAILENGKTVSKIDTHWFLVRVVESATSNPRFRLPTTRFPYVNATESDLSEFLHKTDASDSHDLCDVNFILFIASMIGIESIQYITEYIRNGTQIDRDYIELLHTLVQ